MGYLYILQSDINGRFYIGSTNDLYRRLQEHNKGFSKYTRLTRPFKLVFNQQYSSLEEARRIEYKLKKFKRRSIIEKIIASREIQLKGT